MAFTQKRINVTFTLASGSFAGSTANTVTLTGYRVSAHVVKAGGASQGECQLRIYGMGLSLMNQLSTLGRTPVIVGKNTVSVSAGDDVNGVGVAFVGTISQAYTDLGGAPDAIFHVSAYAGLYQAVQAIPPTSIKGSADAAVIMSSLATQMSLDFENNGVSVMLANPYFPGSARTQAEAVARAANIEWIIDNGKLAIWPKSGSRGGVIPLISPETGLVGYPFPSGQGLLGLRTLFNPTISFGAKIQVQSSITLACGTWTVCHIDHDLESETPNGAWFTMLQGAPPGYLTVQ